MLDLVPPASARRKVTGRDLKALSRWQAVPARPSTVAIDSRYCPHRRRKSASTEHADRVARHRTPPATDALRRKARRVVVVSEVDPAQIPPNVVHPIRDRLAQGWVDEVVNQYFLGLPLRLPLAPRTLVFPDQPLLLGIRRGQRCRKNRLVSRLMYSNWHCGRDVAFLPTSSRFPEDCSPTRAATGPLSRG